MVAQAVAQDRSGEGMRLFDIRRDLLPLADLIELAFREELDQTGSQIAQEMRRVANSGPLLWLFDAFGAALPSAMSGYVWIGDGQLVGNVSLTVENEQRGVWSVSNVAVHPNFRGRSIALRLMEAALEEARNKGARLIVLEVRTDNAPAQRLYHQLGFQVYDSVDELCLADQKWRTTAALPSLALRRRRPSDWRALYDLCKMAIPAGVQQVRPISAWQYRLGVEDRLSSWLDGLVSGRRNIDWVREEDGEIVAWLQVTARRGWAGRSTSAGLGHRVQITVRPRRRGAVEQQLLEMGLYELGHFAARPVTSTISTSHPEALQVWHQAGFYTVRLLDQMWLDLRGDRLETP